MLVLGIPEATFWEADVAFLQGISANKAAYDGWLADARERMAERGR